MRNRRPSRRSILLGISFLLVLIFVFLALLQNIFSLHAYVAGRPGINAVRKVEGETYIMSIDFRPTLNAPVLFEDMTITSLEDGRPLSDRGITAVGYINTIDLTGWFGASAFFTDEMLAPHFADGGLTPIDDTMVTKDSCIFLAFSEIPPIDCPIQMDISYRVLGILPKTETLVHHWDTNYDAEQDTD